MKTARGLRFTAAIPPPEPVIGRVAKALLGSPNPYLSTAAQWHYSSLQIDLTNNTWSDTEIQKHGGVLDLINRVLGGDHADARRWLDERFGAAYAGLDYDHLDVTAGHERAAAVDNRNENGRTAKGDAIEFLRAALADGPRAVRDLEIEARSAGLLQVGRPIGRWKPMRSARDALGVKAYQQSGQKAGGWLWTLPCQMPSDRSDEMDGI